MEELTELAVVRIAHYLGRRDCVFWSRCSTYLYAVVSKCCYLRLTVKQAEVVERVLALRASDWGSGRHSRFPKGFVVATGTSTGKTLISLVCAKQMLLRGQRVLLSVESRLLLQWLGEYKKFAEPLALPPLVVVEPDWLQQYSAHRGQCLVVSSRVHVSPRFLITPGSLSQQLHTVDWNVRAIWQWSLSVGMVGAWRWILQTAAHRQETP